LQGCTDSTIARRNRNHKAGNARRECQGGLGWGSLVAAKRDESRDTKVEEGPEVLREA
jgi:hypothetical protein